MKKSSSPSTSLRNSLNIPPVEALETFAEMSNKIEGIYSSTRHVQHADALIQYLNNPRWCSLSAIEEFVRTIQPDAHLRTQPSHRVFIGGREAMSPLMAKLRVEGLLDNVQNGSIRPWEAHCEYEYIHPFMDGNGRSGRALWLAQMLCWQKLDLADLAYPFLQMFYYQTLTGYAGNHRTNF